MDVRTILEVVKCPPASPRSAASGSNGRDWSARTLRRSARRRFPSSVRLASTISITRVGCRSSHQESAYHIFEEGFQ